MYRRLHGRTRYEWLWLNEKTPSISYRLFNDKNIINFNLDFKVDPIKFNLDDLISDDEEEDDVSIKDIKDIRDTYNAKHHPDVKAGKKTEEEVLAEFLDTFEAHHSLKHPEDKDGKVTLKEFTEYYTNVGSTIDND